MEHGDLATWVDHGIIVVLEGVLAEVPPVVTTKHKVFRSTRDTHWAPAEEWGWSRRGMKVINDKAQRLSMGVEVVTFLSPEVCESAAEWLDKYHVQVSGCMYYAFDLFSESLTWRPNVEFVVDSDQERLHHYGIRAFQVAWGAEF